MRALSSRELLDAWERGRAAGQVERSLCLLEAASPELAPDALAALPVGRRDADLLRLREWAFGSQLLSRAACPACAEGLELSFSVGDIMAEAGAPDAESLTANLNDYGVRFRAPNSLDLLAVDHCADMDEARRLLFARCVIDARRGADEVAPEGLPPEVYDRVVELMSQADPQADVELRLRCPACDHEWEAPFDITSFFWSEIDAWARSLLREIHVIATAYGWSEEDTLALSPRRRRLYLEMILG